MGALPDVDVLHVHHIQGLSLALQHAGVLASPGSDLRDRQGRFLLDNQRKIAQAPRCIYNSLGFPFIALRVTSLRQICHSQKRAALSPRKIFGETAPRTPRAHTTRAEFQKSDLVTFVTGLSGRMMQVRRLPGSSVMRRG